MPSSMTADVPSAQSTPKQDHLEEEKVGLGQKATKTDGTEMIQTADDHDQSHEDLHTIEAMPGMHRSDSKFKLQQEMKNKEKDQRKLYRPEFKYDEAKVGQEKIWELMSSYIGSDK